MTLTPSQKLQYTETHTQQVMLHTYQQLYTKEKGDFRKLWVSNYSVETREKLQASAT